MSEPGPSDDRNDADDGADEVEIRDVDRRFAAYALDHQHPLNVAIHRICVPLILWCAIAALWTVPVPAWLGRPGFWAGMAMFFAVSWYLRLSRPLGYAMLAVFVVFGFASEGLFRLLGAQGLLALAGSGFVLGWIGQFAGHRVEGRRPSFLTDLTSLLIGPAWIVAGLLRRAGIKV